MQLLNFWGLYAQCYDTLARLLPYQNMLEDIVRLAEIKPGMRILVAGCGTGNDIKKITETGIPVEVMGIDFSEEMLAIARKKLPGVRLEKADLSKKLAFSDAEFDIVILSNVLYILPDPKATLLELRRILRVGGKIVGTTPKTQTDIFRILSEQIRLAGLLSIIAYLVPLSLIGIFNAIIVLKGSSGSYHFFAADEIKNLPALVRLNDTYANQCWLFQISKEEVTNDHEHTSPSFP